MDSIRRTSLLKATLLFIVAFCVIVGYFDVLFILHFKDAVFRNGYGWYALLKVVYYQSSSSSAYAIPIAGFVMGLAGFYLFFRERKAGYKKAFRGASIAVILYAILSFCFVAYVVPQQNKQMIWRLFTMRTIKAGEKGQVPSIDLFSDNYQDCDFDELGVQVEEMNREQTERKAKFVNDLKILAPDKVIDSLLLLPGFNPGGLSAEDFSSKETPNAHYSYSPTGIKAMIENYASENSSYDQMKEHYESERMRMMMYPFLVLLLSPIGIFAGVLMRRMHWGIVMIVGIVVAIAGIYFGDILAVMVKLKILTGISSAVLQVLIYIAIAILLFFRTRNSLKKEVSLKL